LGQRAAEGKEKLSVLPLDCPFVKVRAVCPSLSKILHFCGACFFGGSDFAIINSNSASPYRWAVHITKLPKAEHDALEWRVAMITVTSGQQAYEIMV
jgi:hypothetical protein